MDVETGALLLQSSSHGQVSRILSRLGHHFQGTSAPICSFQDASGLKLLETSVEVPRDLLDQTERMTHATEEDSTERCIHRHGNITEKEQQGKYLKIKMWEVKASAVMGAL